MAMCRYEVLRPATVDEALAHLARHGSSAQVIAGGTDLLRSIRTGATSPKVLLSVDKLVQKAEINIHLRGKEIRAEATDADLYAAIDSLADKLDRQVMKYKEKMNDHGHEAIKQQAPL